MYKCFVNSNSVTGTVRNNKGGIKFLMGSKGYRENCMQCYRKPMDAVHIYNAVRYYGTAVNASIKSVG